MASCLVKGSFLSFDLPHFALQEVALYIIDNDLYINIR